MAALSGLLLPLYVVLGLYSSSVGALQYGAPGRAMQDQLTAAQGHLAAVDRSLQAGDDVMINPWTRYPASASNSMVALQLADFASVRQRSSQGQATDAGAHANSGHDSQLGRAGADVQINPQALLAMLKRNARIRAQRGEHACVPVCVCACVCGFPLIANAVQTLCQHRLDPISTVPCTCTAVPDGSRASQALHRILANQRRGNAAATEQAAAAGSADWEYHCTQLDRMNDRVTRTLAVRRLGLVPLPACKLC